MKASNCINTCSVMLLISIVASVSSRALHEDMTKEELAQAFDSVENLPNYQVLPIRYSHVNKRAVNGHVELELKPFGEHFKLWMEPADGVLFSDATPVYQLEKTPGGSLQYYTMTDAMKVYPPAIYKNYEYYATLAVSRDGNRHKRMVGIIGSENLIIRPIPERFVDDITRNRRSVDDIPESEHSEHHYHIVYKRAVVRAPTQLKNSLPNSQVRLDTVYPEILVIVDNHMFKVFKNSVQDLVMYLMAFWNGVDMMYRALDSPQYRLHITAIIIAKNSGALEYIENNRVGRELLEFNRAINMSQYWLYNNLPNIDIDSYDVAATITSLELCDESKDTGECSLGTAGIAYVGGTCKVDKYFSKVVKTVIIHDNGAFSGISVAGHELGHSFGAHHDGEDSNVKCSNEQGHIMSPQTSTTENWADWSKCTLEQFSRFLEVDGTCLYNKPMSGMKLRRLLPGKIRNADDQCKALYGGKASDFNDNICQILWCNTEKKGEISSQGPAVDGTSCGTGKICLHAKCIAESMVTY